MLYCKPQSSETSIICPYCDHEEDAVDIKDEDWYTCPLCTARSIIGIEYTATYTTYPNCKINKEMHKWEPKYPKDEEHIYYKCVYCSEYAHKDEIKDYLKSKGN